MTTKDTVLQFLRDAKGATVSGAQMAAQLGLTRNAVWKAIAGLKADGHEIAATPKKGYCLLKEQDVLSAHRIREFCEANRFGREIHCYSHLVSTNTTAKELAKNGAPEGTVVVADHQTGGRGRKGRSFYSPAGSGLYMTLILRPSFPAEWAGRLTSCAAVAISRAIEQLADIRVGIKWVNDLFAGGKKICGILSEAAFDLESGALAYAVVGFGVNVLAAEMPPEIASVATSIEAVCGQKISRNHLAGAILGELERSYDAIASGSFLDEARRRSIILGKKIRVLTEAESYPALAESIDDEGHLVVRTQNGVRTLFSGEVSIRLEESL